MKKTIIPLDAGSSLVNFVQSVYPVSDQVINYINSHSLPKNVSRGDHLLRAGDIARHFYFIQSGVVRGYVKDGTKEITTWISAEHEIVSSIRGLRSQEPSIENIQAIEACELIAVPIDILHYLYEHYPEMNIVGRRILEQYYISAEDRAFISRIPNASKRYHHFLETQSNLANRISLKYIASYLGMTIETLSRIRSKQTKTRQSAA